jgi:hypothetical protein
MRFDAILILGGGVRQHGELPPWSRARFDLAIERRQGEPLICLSAATTHKPPPLENGFPVAESVAGARYLMRRGVDPASIRIENASLDTIGNAYLAKLIHVDPPGWRRLLVITSEFHIARTRQVFEWIYGFEPGRYELAFEASPNEGMSADGVRSRQEKEIASMRSVRSHMERLRSLGELHHWFFTGHAAYSARGLSRQETSQNHQLLESY